MWASFLRKAKAFCYIHCSLFGTLWSFLSQSKENWDQTRLLFSIIIIVFVVILYWWHKKLLWGSIIRMPKMGNFCGMYTLSLILRMYLPDNPQLYKLRHSCWLALNSWVDCPQAIWDGTSLIREAVQVLHPKQLPPCARVPVPASCLPSLLLRLSLVFLQCHCGSQILAYPGCWPKPVPWQDQGTASTSVCWVSPLPVPHPPGAASALLSTPTFD